MLELIKKDLYRYQPTKYNTFALLKGFRSQGFRYMFFKRLLDHYGIKSVVGIISKFFLFIYTYRYGFQIGGKIGGGLYIGHFGTVVISVNARIGENCNIAHNCTIGNTRGKNAGVPEIKDFVWIGTGSVLVGNISVGPNVMIAPNSFVNFNVPPNSIVIGNPAKIISKENPVKNFINNVYMD